jgi:N-methylhydantoinase A
MPVVNIHTVGAGGGSLAYEEAGGLRVGPESAGATPGPACYGRGGTQATVTDANVVLGRVDPEYFAGGTMALDVDAARGAVAALGAELDLAVDELAEGICDVINAKMAQAIRTLTVEKGIEPRDFALVAFGGAGAMHAAFLARELEIREVIVPAMPGVFSAWGMLETELRRDASRAYYTPLAELDHRELADTLADLERNGLADLGAEGVPQGTGRVRHALDVRYIGQEYTLTIPLTGAGEPLEETFDDVLAGRFHAAHDARFGHANPGAPVEIVTVRSTALGDLGRAEPSRLDEAAEQVTSSATRRVVFGQTPHDTAIVRREELTAGSVLDGPAIVEEATATTVVPPGATVRVDPFGALVVHVAEED